MHFAYAILPALSLLTLGVEGATIAKALTSKHTSELHQARKVIHDRQFHNADFGSGSATPKEEKAPVAQATKHAARGSIVHDLAESGDLATHATDENGSGVNVDPNPEFFNYIFNPASSRRSDGLSTSGDGDIQAPDVGGGAPGKVVSDSTSTGVPVLGVGEPEDTIATPVSEATKDITPGVSSLLGEVSPLSATGSLASFLDPLASGATPALSETLPLVPALTSEGLTRRQDVDSDQAEEVAEEVESMSTSLAGVSSLEGNYVVPHKLERRFHKESREDGSLETDVSGSPVIFQPFPSTKIVSGLFGTRDVAASLPVLPKRQDQDELTTIEVKALGDAQSEDVKLG